MPEAEPFWQQLISDNFAAVAAVVIALVTLVGYIVRRSFEKQKEIRKDRVAAIARWRADVSELRVSVGADFQDSQTYSEIKGFLPADLRKKIEQARGTFTVVLEAGTPAEGESLKGKLLKEITRIERDEWKLL